MTTAAKVGKMVLLYHQLAKIQKKKLAQLPSNSYVAISGQNLKSV